MHEITRWDERNEWLASRDRIGFIGSSDTVALQNDIWTMELYQKHSGGYSIFITLDSDESWFVCDFEDVSDALKPARRDEGFFMNITDALVPYFEGKVSWEKAASEACEIFMKTFESATFVCESCGEIIFPKITVNEHGIFIKSSRTDIKGGMGNRCIKKNVCEECSRKINTKG